MLLNKTACRQALSKKLFVPYLQPIYDAKNSTCIGAEVLARLPYKQSNVLKPEAFLHTINSTKELRVLMHILFEKMSIFLTNNYIPPGFILTFNITADMVGEPWLSKKCSSIMSRTGGKITLVAEITEQQPLTKYSPHWLVNRSLLKETGVLLALDDFGTGCSSLHLLQQTEAEILKLPREFVSTMGEFDFSTSIIDIIVQLADTQGLQVIAEGVETREQLNLLTERGITLMQGYYFSPALCVEAFFEHLDKHGL